MSYVCHTHFQELTAAKDHEAREVIRQQFADCPDCQTARQEAADRIQQTQTIDPSRPYGQHIGLRCKTCGAGYQTKNIDYIGARTVFGPDCGHPMGDLEVAPQTCPKCGCANVPGGHAAGCQDGQPRWQ